jgi:NADPH2:quinone reductase
MIQVQIDEFGGPEVLHAVYRPDPLPGPGQVVIGVNAAGITFVETQVRADRFRPPTMADLVLPIVLGNGVEGPIVAVGAGVDPARIGQRVVSATGGTGGYADRVVVDGDTPIPVPDGLARGQSVAMLADGRTALAQIRVAEVKAGERVLVLAAAGGVGSLLVQLAKAAGATVVAAAGGATKAAVAAELGADRTVDYSEPSWADAVGDVDVVFDGVGGELGVAAAGLLIDGGKRVTIGMASGVWAQIPVDPTRKIEELRGMPTGPDDNRALVEQALALAAAGELRAIVGQTFDLAHAADAHRAIESRSTIGKTILVPDDQVSADVRGGAPA